MGGEAERGGEQRKEEWGGDSEKMEREGEDMGTYYYSIYM